jgi:hypothetical protein
LTFLGNGTTLLAGLGELPARFWLSLCPIAGSWENESTDYRVILKMDGEEIDFGSIGLKTFTSDHTANEWMKLADIAEATI